MIIAAPPPAIHAPAKPCSDGKPVGLTVSESKTVRSPDCRWAIFWPSESQQRPGFPVNGWDGNGTPLIDLKTHKVVATFAMEESSMIHWLKDGRHLIVNYFDGSGAAEPLAISLPPASTRPTDLAALVLPDVLKRIHKRRSQVYHYYAYYLADEGDSITISAEPNHTLRGDTGPGGGKCYLYSVNKISFRYRFIRELPDDDDAYPCPQNADEHRN